MPPKNENQNPLEPQTAIIEQHVEETDDIFSLYVRPQINDFNFRPGQFAMIGLPGYGEAPFSFSVIDPRSRMLVQTIRKAGTVVDALSALHSGGQVSFRGPFGNGWPLEKLDGKNVIVIAGGIGMAPLRPVIHHLIENRSRFGEIYLFYGVKTIEDLLFSDDLEKWSASIHVLLSADEVRQNCRLPVRQGLVTVLFDQLLEPLSDAVTFTCGPQIMMKFAAAHLILQGQAATDIYVSLERRMKCGIAQCGHCQIGAKYVCMDGPVFCLPDIQRFADTFL
ncbi:MAG: FAD/NAD(P)-binding protein [Planctomycetaceae bacterium]|nr:FAD/NAD(P)-binding protein [Planctomycetaceae bacterium]